MFYWVILALVAVALIVTHLIERSRFGAWLIAVRENEDAAMALGVDATAVKLAAMIISGAITAAAGCFYAQYFLFVDSGIAYGTWISIEALLTPIIGGVGTVFGPLLGALVVKALGEGAMMVTGDAPGLDLVVFGCVLVLVIWFSPRGLIGVGAELRERFRGAGTRPARGRRPAMAEPLLAVRGVSHRFGGLLAVNGVSLSAAHRPHHRADRPQRRRQDHAVCRHLRLPQAERRHACATAARTSPASRRIGWRGAASPAPSRSCSPSPA